MKIQLISDIHLEFGEFNPPRTDADVVVLAGDIGLGVQGMYWAASQPSFSGKPIVYISGNHEFYGTRLERTAVELRRSASDLGIHYLDNDAIEINGIRFIGTTLWSDFELFGVDRCGQAMGFARSQLTDCGRIVYGTTGWIRPEKMIEMHRISKEFIGQELDLALSIGQKTVVISHHAPSMLSVPRDRQDLLISAAYASNLEAIVEKADLWLHGHVHQHCDYRVKNCRVACNPRGYVENGDAQDTGFVANFLVDI